VVKRKKRLDPKIAGPQTGTGKKKNYGGKKESPLPLADGCIQDSYHGTDFREIGCLARRHQTMKKSTPEKKKNADKKKRPREDQTKSRG